MRGLVFFVVSLLAPAVAAAQPGATTAEEAAPSGRYPASLAERPLWLPQGVYEASAQLRTISVEAAEIGWFEYLYSDFRVRAGLGSAEVFAEADVLLEDPYDREPVDRIAAGVLVPMTRNGAGLLRASLWAPAEDYKTVDLQGVFLVRRQTAADVAVQGGGGFNFRSTLPEDEDGFYFLNVEGHLGAQVQLGRTLGLDFGVRIAVPVADNADYDLAHSTETRIGGRLVHATRRLDLFAGVELQSAYYSQRVLTAGVVGRLP